MKLPFDFTRNPGTAPPRVNRGVGLVSALGLAILLGLIGAGAVIAQTGDDYDLERQFIGGTGGDFPSGGDYQLGFTLGQEPDGQVSTGGDYQLVQGFWHAQPSSGPVLLVVSKGVQPNRGVVHHGTLTYTVVLTNTGPGNATGTFLTDTLPAQVEFGHWIEQNGAAVNTGQITWQGSLTAGHSLTWTWSVTHVGDYGQTVSNTVVYSQSDAGSGSAQASFTVKEGDIFLPVITIDGPLHFDSAGED